MQTCYRLYNIEYSVSLSNGMYRGHTTIARLPSGDSKGKAVKSGYLQSFPTEENALGHALHWAKQWCDEQ
jgi:hypothetical protein